MGTEFIGCIAWTQYNTARIIVKSLIYRSEISQFTNNVLIYFGCNGNVIEKKNFNTQRTEERERERNKHTQTYTCKYIYTDETFPYKSIIRWTFVAHNRGIDKNEKTMRFILIMSNGEESNMHLISLVHEVEESAHLLLHHRENWISEEN